MKLVGQLSRSFGNFLTLRGVGKMGDIEKISEADEAYQRDLYSQHGAAMKAFLEAGEYTFFPELILSVTLDEIGDNQEEVDNVYNSVPDQTFYQKFNGFSLKGSKQKIISTDESRAYNYFNRGILKIGSLQNGKKLFNRIDGNHRLSATNEANKQDTLVPFCIIFLRNKEEAKKTNRILFTNINYKHLSLTSEENYRLILDKYDGEYLYTDKELENPVWFGKHFVLARKALGKLNLDNLQNIQKVLQKDGNHFCTRTALVDLFKLPRIEPRKLKLETALQKVNQCYEAYTQGKIANNYHLLIVHLYFYQKGCLKPFSNWILKNHLYELNSVDVDSLISIFEKILKSKERTIFLAMDFSEEAKQNYSAIENAIDDINSSCTEYLKLTLLRIDKNETGHSFTITDRILNQIENGGYFIADLSLGNKNVYHEIGYQMGLNKGKGLEQDNFLLVHNKGLKDAIFDKDKSFNISNISIVAASDSNDLREKVKIQIKKHYGFN